LTQVQITDSGPVVFSRGHFDDLSEFERVTTDWDLDFRQLDRGSSPVEAIQIMTEHAHLMHLRFERRYHQRGGPPARTLNFGIPEFDGEPLSWHSGEVEKPWLICFAPGSDFDLVSRAGFSGTTLSFDPDHLASIADFLGRPDLLEGADKLQILTGADPQLIARLRHVAADLVLADKHQGLGMSASLLAATLNEEIPQRLLEAVASCHGPRHTARPSPFVRTLARKRAVAFIDAHADAAPTVRQICLAAEVSWRTLDYAFKEHFQVTPKEYLHAVRLQGVRREIQQKGGETIIANAANNWGFWHMGQFAADYGLKFGELPSITRGVPSADAGEDRAVDS